MLTKGTPRSLSRIANLASTPAGRAALERIQRDVEGMPFEAHMLNAELSYAETTVAAEAYWAGVRAQIESQRARNPANVGHAVLDASPANAKGWLAGLRAALQSWSGPV
jgi:hypothetical protein